MSPMLQLVRHSIFAQLLHLLQIKLIFAMVVLDIGITALMKKILHVGDVVTSLIRASALLMSVA